MSLPVYPSGIGKEYEEITVEEVMRLFNSEHIIKSKEVLKKDLNKIWYIISEQDGSPLYQRIRERLYRSYTPNERDKLQFSENKYKNIRLEPIYSLALIPSKSKQIVKMQESEYPIDEEGFTLSVGFIKGVGSLWNWGKTSKDIDIVIEQYSDTELYKTSEKIITRILDSANLGERVSYHFAQDSLGPYSDYANLFDLVLIPYKEEVVEHSKFKLFPSSHMEFEKPLAGRYKNKHYNFQDLLKIIKQEGYSLSDVWYCLPKGERILTDNIPKNIESVEIGDYVLGNDGKYNKVKNIFKREFIGDLVEIKPLNLPPLLVTPEHEIRIVESKECKWSSGEGRKRRTCKEKLHGCSTIPNKEIIWKKASEIGKDFIFFPYYNEYSNITEIELPISNYTKIHSKGNKVSICNSRYIPKKLKLSNSFARILGWYLAEGNATDKGIQFTLCVTEQDYISEINEDLKKLFGLPVNIYNYKDGNNPKAVSIVVNNRILKDWFKSEFDMKKNKRIPKFVMEASDEFIKEFIIAYWKGDGTDSNFSRVISTCSLNIANQFIQLCSKLKFLPSVSKKRCEERFGKDYFYTLAIFGEGEDIIFGNRNYKSKFDSKKYWKDDNGIYLPVKVKYKPYEGTVYNIETEDNTYLTSSGLVHNCGIKRDGLTSRVDWDGDKVEIHSAGWKNITTNMPTIVGEFQKRTDSGSAIGEIELYINGKHESRADASAAAVHPNNPNEPNLRITLYDLFYINGKDISSEPYSERRNQLTKLKQSEHVFVSNPEYKVSNAKDLENAIERCMAPDWSEGAVLKHSKKPYAFKVHPANPGMIKIKKTFIITGRVVGREPVSGSKDTFVYDVAIDGSKIEKI